MNLSPFEAEVANYFDRSTPGFYLQGWDPEHIHYGLFDPTRNGTYRVSLEAAMADRAPAIERMTERVLAQATISPGMRVVDAGCGVGGVSLLLAQRGCRVTGVNISPDQLEIASNRATERGLADRADFVRANCSEHLPFQDASVDLVVNFESACHYENRPRFLAEVARILKPGGQIAASDWVIAENLKVSEKKRLAAMGKVWRLAPQLESMKSYQKLLKSVGLHVTTTEVLGEEADANGWILHHGAQRLRGFPDFLLDSEALERREQARTFADTLLNRLLLIGLYGAVKEPHP